MTKDEAKAIFADMRKKMNDAIDKAEYYHLACTKPPVFQGELRGCICPPGAEKTCMGASCPRRNICAYAHNPNMMPR